MKNKINCRREFVYWLSGLLLTVMIANSAWSIATSNATSTVRGCAPVVTQSIIVSDDANGNGLLDIGDTLRIGTAGIFSDKDADEAIAETYQWQANGENIVGAIDNTYIIVAGVLGKTITVLVTPHTDPTITDPANGLAVVSTALRVSGEGAVTDDRVTPKP